MENTAKKIRKTKIKMENQNKPENFFESIYVHIPFCEIKCPYCDFNAYSDVDHLTENLINSIEKEIVYWGTLFKNQKIKSIFFGGGTPSWIESKYIQNIIKIIKENFNLNKDIEITLESNPMDLTKTKIDDYLHAGINRFSVGIQSLNDKTLKFIGRNHNRKEALKSLKNLNDKKANNFSVDIMFGIPYQTVAEIKETVETLIKFNPTHFSSYSFTIEPNTPFHKFVKEKKIKELDEDIYIDIFNTIYSILKNNNYINYEISNWALKGYESTHNTNYWDNNNFLGVGPGAHSYINEIRFSNTKSPKKYIEQIEKCKNNNNLQIHNFNEFIKTINFIYDHEIITKDAKQKEYIIFSLRKNTGLSKSKFKKEFNENIEKFLPENLNNFIDYNLIKTDEDIIKLTDKGKLLSNELFREILYPSGK